MNTSSGKFYVKNTSGGSYQDLTAKFNGLAIMKVDGLNELGAPINIYSSQWINSQTEDFLITTLNGNDQPVVIRKNVDIEITFVISRRYATTTIDELTIHDSFIQYMTNTDVWIKSSYMGNKERHCICLDSYKPTLVQIKRGNNSFITGTLKLHHIGN